MAAADFRGRRPQGDVVKKLLPLLALPLCLFAQVEVDTIIDLGRCIYGGHYIPELNKLYAMGPYWVVALDCSTWQKTAEFPTDAPYGGTKYIWNPLRHKLYVSINYLMDSTLVIDAVTDSAWWIRPGFKDIEYVASKDLLYGTPWNRSDLWILDCATDTVVRTIEPPVPDYGMGTLTWDPVNDRVYVNVSSWGGTPHMAVYDVPTDSLLALFPLGCVPPLKLSFHPERHKAYSVSGVGFGGPPGAGVIDTDSPVRINLLPFKSHGYFFSNLHRGPVSTNFLMDKVYFGGNSGTGPLPRSCTLFVVDCATDSIIKEIEFRGRGAHTYVVWVPWSNRVYFDADDRFHAAVLDCETDSLIVPELVLPGQDWAPADILLDPIRERIFAIAADTTAIHVLRDVTSGLAEGQVPAGFPPMLPLVHPNPARNLIWLGSDDRVMLYSPDGRSAACLNPGVTDVARLPRGVYFGRCPGSSRSVRLVLVD